MSTIELVQGSAVNQEADAVVNAANKYLAAGGGICGAIFQKAGKSQLTQACSQHATPLNDGDAVMTPAFGITNAKSIIHAVGPDFRVTPTAVKELFDAYYNSLVVLKDNGCHSISFPLISSGIFSGNLPAPVTESTRQCCRAYKKFTADYPDYPIIVKLCVFSPAEYDEAQKEFSYQQGQL